MVDLNRSAQPLAAAPTQVARGDPATVRFDKSNEKLWSVLNELW
jgi:hypothetical protein